MTDDTNNTAPEDTAAEVEETAELATPEDPATPIEETAQPVVNDQAHADELEETTASEDAEPEDAEVEDHWHWVKI